MAWFDRTYVAIVRAVERSFPGPARLGEPLTAQGVASARAADPVLLVHGTGNSTRTWDEFARSLTADGFDVHRATLPNAGMGGAMEGAQALATQVADLRAATGRDVQLLGFSYGGVVSRAFLELAGGWKTGVSQLVTIATPHHGTEISRPFAWLARWGAAGADAHATRDVLPNAPFMQRLNAAYDPAMGQRYTSIYAGAFDGFVAPPSSARLPNARNVRLEPRVGGKLVSLDPNHYSIVHHSNAAYEAARRALLRRATPA